MIQNTLQPKPKPVLYHEVAYLLGICILSFSVTLMMRSELGNTGGTALPYLLNLRFPVFTIGVWSYLIQGIFLIAMVILIGRMKTWYLLAFVTSMIYGYAIDFFNWLLGNFQVSGIVGSLLCYLISFIFFGIGIAFFMVSNMPPVIYDLFAREVSKHFSWSVGKVKTVIDMIVLSLSLFCSFFFFHRLVGIGVATVITSVCGGTYMHMIKRLLDRHFSYAPFFRWNKQELKAEQNSEQAIEKNEEIF